MAPASMSMGCAVSGSTTLVTMALLSAVVLKASALISFTAKMLLPTWVVAFTTTVISVWVACWGTSIAVTATGMMVMPPMVSGAPAGSMSSFTPGTSFDSSFVSSASVGIWMS